MYKRQAQSIAIDVLDRACDGGGRDARAPHWRAETERVRAPTGFFWKVNNWVVDLRTLRGAYPLVDHTDTYHRAGEFSTEESIDEVLRYAFPHAADKAHANASRHIALEAGLSELGICSCGMNSPERSNRNLDCAGLLEEPSAETELRFAPKDWKNPPEVAERSRQIHFDPDETGAHAPAPRAPRPRPQLVRGIQPWLQGRGR